MKTTSGKIVVKPSKNDEISKGGVIIPDHSVRTVSGVVISKGSVNHTPPYENDIVVYEKIDAREVEVDGEVFHVLRKEDILVIL